MQELVIKRSKWLLTALFFILLFTAKDLSAATKTIEVGGNTVLTDENWYNATGYTKTWRISNSAIASIVGNGTMCMVYGKKSGTAIVTCETYAWKTVYTTVLGADGKWYNRENTTYHTSTSNHKIVVKDRFTVTFLANGGSASTEKIEVIEGNAIGELPSATRQEYNFLGWYTSENGGQIVSKDTVCESNLTLYAHWEKVSVEKIVYAG